MAVVVLFDAYCTCVAIDHRAAQLSTPDFYKVSSDACLVLYTVELILMLYNSGGFASVKDWMTMMDAVIVICGWLEFIFDALNISEFEIGFRIKVTRVLRLVRIFRLIRLLKRIRTLKELHKLATMMATCMRTLLWCFLLCFFIMTAWAMLMAARSFFMCVVLSHIIHIIALIKRNLKQKNTIQVRRASQIKSGRGSEPNSSRHGASLQ